VIVIVDHDQVAQLEMTGNTRSFTGDAFHCATIAEEAVSVVVD